jgi:pyruvate formate lyase activating enzyme
MDEVIDTPKAYVTIENTITCNICPRECELRNHYSGYCSCYSNQDGALNYEGNGVFSAVNIEQIDKKPFFHFFPGAKTLSFGSYGCNLSCEFCQNHEITQEIFNFNDLRKYEEHPSLTYIFEKAKQNNINIFVFTYNEPLLHLSWYRPIIERAKSQGIKVLFKTNGFVNENVFDEALDLIDGFNIDLKLMRNSKTLGLTSEQYSNYLDLVYKYIRKTIEKKKHLEVSAICIYPRNYPFLKENFARLLDISDNIPIHLLKHIRFNKSKDDTTSDLDLISWRKHLMESGFRYVYNGYPATVYNTYCQYCGASVVERDGFVPVHKFYTVKDGRASCNFCNRILPIIDR